MILLTSAEVLRLDLIILADQMRSAGIPIPIGLATLGPGSDQPQVMGSLTPEGTLDELPPEANVIVQNYLNGYLDPRTRILTQIDQATTIDEVKVVLRELAR